MKGRTPVIKIWFIGSGRRNFWCSPPAANPECSYNHCMWPSAAVLPTFVAAPNAAAAERRACASSQAFAAVFSKYGEGISIYVDKVHQLIGSCAWRGIATGACRRASNKRAHSLMWFLRFPPRVRSSSSITTKTLFKRYTRGIRSARTNWSLEITKSSSAQHHMSSEF